jgi:hypothetical protein
VATEFEIEKAGEESDDTAFSIHPKKGAIPPESTFPVTIKYQPKLVGVWSNAHYTIQSKGGNYLNLSCFGVGIGYDVHLSAKSMNFGEVSLGNTTNRLVNVTNNSELPTSFQFLVDGK